jgi:general secretion pathway protein A
LYLQFFGLNEPPFSITPDPAFVFLSEAHREALAHLLYGIGQGGAGGFVQLTGEVGTGKTTLCRCLLEQVPEDTRIALILNPLVTPRELLVGICEELGMEVAAMADSNKALVDALNGFLLAEHAAGRRVVVVIDEAHNLSPDALEQVRLLTNLETSKDKLLQIVLLGQPELRTLLQRKSLRQLAQRITARYHLAPLSAAETAAYVRHRMRVAGARQNPFNRSALRALYQRSEGIPRLINIIADRALVGAFADESQTVGARLVNAAANEVQPSESRVRRSRWPALVATASALGLLAVTVALVELPLDPDRPETRKPLADPGPGPVAIPPGAAPEDPRPAVANPAVDPAVGGLQPPEVIPNRPPALPDRLEDTWLDNQHRRAFRIMADLWGDSSGARDIEAACDGASGRGYSCLRESGSWARVRNLGLPVLLVLQGAEPRYVVLRGMTRNGLLLGDESDSLEVSRAAVESRWLGEFLLPWPQADDWPAEISRGETGSAVDIVLEMATFAEPPWDGGTRFDDRFEAWLVAFQKRHGLKPDGIVGRVTLLYLLAPTIVEPRLITIEEENS